MATLEAKTDRVEQETSYYCGAACAAMLLNRIGIVARQDDIYKIIRNNNVEPEAFYTDPQGLLGLLNDPNTDPFVRGGIIIFDSGTEDEYVNKIFDNILDNVLPVVCLINHGNHWVVCHKALYELDDQRKTIIYGLFLLDPSPGVSREVYVPIDQFTQRVLNANTFGQRWRGKRILIIGREEVTRQVSLVRSTQSSPMGGGSGEPDDDKIFQNLRRVGLAHVRKPLGGGGSPLEVIDIRDGSKYFIIALDAKLQAAFGEMIFVAVDAHSRILEITFERGMRLFATDELANEAVSAIVGPDKFALDPGLFWKSGSVLPNRFMLARKAVMQNQDLWILQDGRVLHDLDVGARGGQ